MALYAQEKKYIDGYGDLQLGSSVEQMKGKYPNMKEVTVNDLQSGETVYLSKSDDSLTLRTFRFYNGRLHCARGLISQRMTTAA